MAAGGGRTSPRGFHPPAPPGTRPHGQQIEVISWKQPHTWTWEVLKLSLLETFGACVLIVRVEETIPTKA